VNIGVHLLFNINLNNYRELEVRNFGV
jgi:hypothetical protein